MEEIRTYADRDRARNAATLMDGQMLLKEARCRCGAPAVEVSRERRSSGLQVAASCQAHRTGPASPTISDHRLRLALAEAELR